MKRASQMGFLLCFLGILAAVPLLIALRGADNQTSYYENRTLAAVYHQHPVAALLHSQPTSLSLGTWSKYDLCGKGKGKCVHGNSSCPFSFLFPLYHIHLPAARQPGHFLSGHIGWTVA